MAKNTALPLARYSVLDLTRARAGPTCVRQLVDWGARAIKIEMPGGRSGDGMGGNRHGFDFQNLHRNKQAMTLNLREPEGVAIFKRLAKDVDVVVENYRPDVKRRLGIDYESLRAINPRLIYGSISGFGQSGPYRDRPGVDQIAQGMGGRPGAGLRPSRRADPAGHRRRRTDALLQAARAIGDPSRREHRRRGAGDDQRGDLMAEEIVMPRLSDSMEEGTVLKWMKAVGDEVALGDELVEIETDKANMVFEADAAGTLIEIVADEGDTLPIGEVIARVGEAGEAPSGSADGDEAAASGDGGEAPSGSPRSAADSPPEPPADSAEPEAPADEASGSPTPPPPRLEGMGMGG